jgi:type II secretory pathway pseudopilin PulG
VTRDGWRKILSYAPIAAVLVIVVALAMDLIFGGPGKPEVDNSAPPPDVLRATIAAAPHSPTPYAPPPTKTPTPGPTAVPGVVAAERDQTRLIDLATITAALEQYRQKEGEYPSTGGSIQTLCTYKDLDAGCKLEDLLSPIPSDPLGDSVKNGYWYSSDGKSFVIVGGMDSPSNATPTKCEQRFAQHTKKANLCCLTGPS